MTAPTVLDEFRNLGRRSIGVEADVTQKTEVEAMFNRIIDEFGKIAIGTSLSGSVSETRQTLQRKTSSINSTSTSGAPSSAAKPLQRQ